MTLDGVANTEAGCVGVGGEVVFGLSSGVPVATLAALSESCEAVFMTQVSEAKPVPAFPARSLTFVKSIFRR